MNKLIFNQAEYRDKVLACWLGKNIGGTVGAPFEWFRQINDVSFYTQELGGEPLPNDDLDIQLLWVVALEEMGVSLNAHMLAEYWCNFVTPHWAEYGMGKINMRSGILPPLSGTVNNNEFKDSCGAFIRSEIWACIAPGQPMIAARYAYEDAILDHGNGEGTFAEVFCAVLESAAFVLTDLRALVEIALTYIPKECGIAQAVHTAIAAFEARKDWKAARDLILEKHRGNMFMNRPERISAEDIRKGFQEGKLGYDAPSNIGLLVLSLLYGGNDFGKTICTAVNCGEDTDCTAATAGAIFGIMKGTKSIPQKWIDPIGRKIKTACLNLGELGMLGSLLPQTVDELTDRTEKIALQVLAFRCPKTAAIVADVKNELVVVPEELKCKDWGAELYQNLNGPVFQFPFYNIEVDYGTSPHIQSGREKRLRVTVQQTHRIPANLTLHWYLPQGWRVTPAGDKKVVCTNWKKRQTMEFVLQADAILQAANRCVLEVTIDARPGVMLAPIMLLNGD